MTKELTDTIIDYLRKRPAKEKIFRENNVRYRVKYYSTARVSPLPVLHVYVSGKTKRDSLNGSYDVGFFFSEFKEDGIFTGEYDSLHISSTPNLVYSDVYIPGDWPLKEKFQEIYTQYKNDIVKKLEKSAEDTI